MVSFRCLLFGVLLLTLFPLSAGALVLTPRKLLSQSVVQLRQEVVAMQRDGKQELRLRVKLSAWPALRGELLWLMSFPTRPLLARTGRHASFVAIHHWTARHLRRDKSARKTKHSNPALLAKTSSPLFSTLRAEQLNGWLRDRGYAGVPLGTLESLRKRQPWFLAVRLTCRAPLSKGWLPPVRVVFRSSSLHVPLRLTGFQALRHLRITVVNDRPIDTWGSFYALRMVRAVERGKYENLLETDGYFFNRRWPARSLPLPVANWSGGEGSWFVHVFDRPNPNPKRHLLNFDTDFSLSLGMTAREAQLGRLRKRWHRSKSGRKSIRRALLQWLPPSEAKNATRLRAKVWEKLALGGGTGGSSSALQKKVAKFMNQKSGSSAAFRWILLSLTLLMALVGGFAAWWKWRQHRQVQRWVEDSADER